MQTYEKMSQISRFRSERTIHCTDVGRFYCCPVVGTEERTASAGLYQCRAGRRPTVADPRGYGTYNPFSIKEFKADKQYVLDVLVRDESHRRYNMEIQSAPHPGVLQSNGIAMGKCVFVSVTSG